MSGNGLSKTEQPRQLTLAEDVLDAAIKSRGEIGISGTINYAGRPQVEENERLRDQAAYGSPASTTWGEWERLQKTDSAIASALEMVVSKIRDAELEVKPASDDEKDKTIAEFVLENLRDWMEPGFSLFSDSAVKTALGIGFSVNELVWGTRADERVPGGTAVFLSKMAERLASSIDTNGWVEQNGELALIRQSGIRSGSQYGGQWVRVEIPSDKLFLLTWARTGNNYLGFSAFRSVWYLARIRAELLKIIGVGHQREANGIPLAELDKDADLTADQIDKLQQVLEFNSFHENAAVVAPRGVKLSWLFSPGANKGHVIETWRELGLAIHEVVHTQQVTLGTGDTGSRAVGEVHDASKNDFISGVKGWFEANLNGIGNRPYTGVVRKIVDLNFGPQKTYPKVSLSIRKSEIPVAEFSAAVKAMSEAGAINLTVDDENEVRRRIGLKPLAPEDRTIAPTVPGLPGQAPAPEAEKVQDTALNGAQVSSLVGVVAGVAAGQLPRESAIEIIVSAFQVSREQAERILGTVGRGFKPEPMQKDETGKPEFGFADEPVVVAYKPRRPLRLEENHLSLGEMDSFLTSSREEFERDVKPIVAAMVKDAKGKIKDAMNDGNPSELSSLKLNSKALEQYVGDFLSRARAFGRSQAEKEKSKQPKDLIAKRKKGSQELAPQPLGLVDKFRPKQVDKALDAQKKMLTRRIVSRTLSAIESEAISQAQTGGDADSIVENVLADAEESHQLRNDAGAVVTRTFNMGREEFAELNEGKIEAVQYSAILDGRQCVECDGEDGKEFDFGSPEHIEHIPPYSECQGGNQCRCLLVYIWADE